MSIRVCLINFICVSDGRLASVVISSSENTGSSEKGGRVGLNGSSKALIEGGYDSL